MYVKYQLSLKVQEVAREIDQIVRVLEGKGQAIWTIARSRYETCYPSDMREAARNEQHPVLHVEECCWFLHPQGG